MELVGGKVKEHGFRSDQLVVFGRSWWVRTPPAIPPGQLTEATVTGQIWGDGNIRLLQVVDVKPVVDIDMTATMGKRPAPVGARTL